MTAAKLGQRLERLGEEIRPPRFWLQRQRDDRRLCPSGEDLDDLVLRSREIGEAVEDQRREEGRGGASAFRLD